VSINNLGELRYAKGDLVGVEPLYEESLVARRRTLGDEHPDTLTSIYNLGKLLAAKGDLPRAIVLFEEELRGVPRHGEQHEETQDSIENLERVRAQLAAGGGSATTAVEGAPTSEQPSEGVPPPRQKSTTDAQTNDDAVA
jgi:hypothetical protein